MANYKRFINDEQWKLLEPLLPKAKPSAKGVRPPIDNREVLEGILWVLHTGARWQDMPNGIVICRLSKLSLKKYLFS